MVKSLTSVIRVACLAVVCINAIYLSSCYVYYRGDSGFRMDVFSKLPYQQMNVDLDAADPNMGLYNTNANYSQEIEGLLAEVAANPNNDYWLTDTSLTDPEIVVDPSLFLKDTSSPKAWKNRNDIFYDPRLTMSLYVNYIKTKLVNNETGIEVPFHWVDWVDMTRLNHELEKPLLDRTNCEWIKEFTDIGRNADISKLNCLNNQDLSPNAVQQLGFDSHDQLPGYINYDYSENRALHNVRISQGKSYVLTHMPNPFRIMFLSADGGTYEVDVAPGKDRITRSGLMNNYLENNFAQDGGIKQYLKESVLSPSLNLDPSKEFRSLKNSVASQIIGPEEDPYGMYASVHDNTANKSLNLPSESFTYPPSYVEKQIALFSRKSRQSGLTSNEEAYLESLQFSRDRNTFTEDTYFKQSTLEFQNDDKNRDNDRGWHYDWRFFNGALGYQSSGWNSEELTQRTSVILDRLLRNWFRFTQEKGLVSWIMHGPLLSWYWNAFMFPFDNDIDVQMPARELARLGELFNQTLVIEDLEEGYGKYLVDVGTYVHNRDISRSANHIDARFIDVDTGIYIDITGLSVSTASVPNEFYEKGLIAINEPNAVIYNDRRKHFYTHEQLSPLRYSMMGGVPVHLPKDLTERLRFEYPRGLSRAEFLDWFYVPRLGLWLKKDQLTQVLDDNDSRIIYADGKAGDYNNDKIISLVVDMSDEEAYRLLKLDRAILSEYYLTREHTLFHEMESQFIFTKLENGDVADNPDLFTDPELFKTYAEFVNANVGFSQPRRKLLFQYENIEQPQHHDPSLPFAPGDKVSE